LDVESLHHHHHQHLAKNRKNRIEKRRTERNKKRKRAAAKVNAQRIKRGQAGAAIIYKSQKLARPSLHSPTSLLFPPEKQRKVKQLPHLRNTYLNCEFS